MDTQETMGATIALCVGVGVMLLAMILIGAMGGSTYEMTEDDLLSIGSDTYSGTFTADNTTWTSIGHALVDNSTLTMVNATGVDVKVNFTVNATTGLVLLVAGDATHNGTLITAAYTYDTSVGGKSVRDNVMSGIGSSFKALKTTGSYLPIIVLAIVIFLVLTLVLGFAGTGGAVIGGKGSGEGSGAL